MQRIHFISGLPRSGSTLLAAILRQNPRIHAGMQSPLVDAVAATLRALSMSEAELFVSDSQRRAMLTALVDAFYSDYKADGLVFDTHRLWCALLPAVADIMPRAKVICCVRNPAWILDSMERLAQRNALRLSKMFNYEIGDVFSRVEMLNKQVFGPSLKALAQAWHSDHAGALIVIRYESLVSRPHDTIAEVYKCLNEPLFPHDFGDVRFSAQEFDARLGTPGLHDVAGPVAPRTRRTILPPELFAQYNHEFWTAPTGNPMGVLVI